MIVKVNELVTNYPKLLEFNIKWKFIYLLFIS